MKTAKDFFIINDFDEPSERMLTIKINGRLKYIHPDKAREEDYKAGEETSLDRFGFAVGFDGKKLHFEQAYTNVALYRDGSPRWWQGQRSFAIPIEWVEKYDKTPTETRQITTNQLFGAFGTFRFMQQSNAWLEASKDELKRTLETANIDPLLDNIGDDGFHAVLFVDALKKMGIECDEFTKKTSNFFDDKIIPEVAARIAKDLENGEE